MLNTATLSPSKGSHNRQPSSTARRHLHPPRGAEQIAAGASHTPHRRGQQLSAIYTCEHCDETYRHPISAALCCDIISAELSDDLDLDGTPLTHGGTA